MKFHYNFNHLITWDIPAMDNPSKSRNSQESRLGNDCVIYESLNELINLRKFLWGKISARLNIVKCFQK